MKKKRKVKTTKYWIRREIKKKKAFFLLLLHYYVTCVYARIFFIFYLNFLLVKLLNKIPQFNLQSHAKYSTCFFPFFFKKTKKSLRCILNIWGEQKRIH